MLEEESLTALSHSLPEAGMSENRDHRAKEQTDNSMSLETVIAMGIFGWIALSMTMMGLGIW